jgi:hypothetical protein
MAISLIGNGKRWSGVVSGHVRTRLTSAGDVVSHSIGSVTVVGLDAESREWVSALGRAGGRERDARRSDWTPCCCASSATR